MSAVASPAVTVSRVSEPAAGTGRLRRRLLILRVGGLLQAVMLWPAVEKLFLSELGFTAATIGLMAATYTAVVPLLEVPSGVAADRGSRRLMLVIAAITSGISAMVGWLSHGVGIYLVAAVFLGIFFAFSSGTTDSIVYDALLEESGGAESYEREIGKIRMFETAGLVGSALLGGVLAELFSARSTYLATIPFALAAALVFARLDEPRLHRTDRPTPLREQISVTVRTITRQRQVRTPIVLAALIGMLAQAIYEFGPLWLVAAKASPALYGPYWAVLVSAVGVGGYLVGRLDLAARRVVIGAATALLIPALALAAVDLPVVLLILSQFVMALALAMLGVHAGKLVHDSVDSTIRSGVSSSVGTLSALIFLPFSIAFGLATRLLSLHVSAWAFVLITAVLVGLLLRSHHRSASRTDPPELRRHRHPTEQALDDTGHHAATELACQDAVGLISKFLDGELDADLSTAVREHLDRCPDCRDYAQQLLRLIDALSATVAEPAHSDSMEDRA